MLKVHSPSKSLRAKPGDLDEVMALYASTHEGWPVKPPEWFRSVNTLVIKDRGHVVAAAFFSIAPAPTPELDAQTGSVGPVCYLLDSAVAPSHRKQGLATLLLQERVRLARDAGCSMVVGATSTTNEAMRTILDREDGFTLAANPPVLYPWLDEPGGLVYLCYLTNGDR